MWVILLLAPREPLFVPKFQSLISNPLYAFSPLLFPLQGTENVCVWERERDRERHRKRKNEREREMENRYSHEQCVNKKAECDLSFLELLISHQQDNSSMGWIKRGTQNRAGNAMPCTVMFIIPGILCSAQKTNTIKENWKEKNAQSETPSKMVSFKNISTF